MMERGGCDGGKMSYRTRGRARAREYVQRHPWNMTQGSKAKWIERNSKAEIRNQLIGKRN